MVWIKLVLLLKSRRIKVDSRNERWRVQNRFVPDRTNEKPFLTTNAFDNVSFCHSPNSVLRTTCLRVTVTQDAITAIAAIFYGYRLIPVFSRCLRNVDSFRFVISFIAAIRPNCRPIVRRVIITACAALYIASDLQAAVGGRLTRVPATPFRTTVMIEIRSRRDCDLRAFLLSRALRTALDPDAGP